MTAKGNKIRSLFLLLGTAIIHAACASVSITSNPKDADVVLEIPGQKSGKVLGKPPSPVR